MALGLTGRINQQLNSIRTEIAAMTKRWTVVGKGAVLEDYMKVAQVIEPQSLHFQESSNFNQQQAAKRKAAVVGKEFSVIFVLQPR